jgi:hypothetical protein
VGRLDNILARNRRPNGMHERMVVSLVFGAIVLLILGLAVFTDLGLPPEEREARGTRGQPSEPGGPGGAGSQATPGAPATDRGKRVDGVLLRVPPARPARH